MDHVIQSYRTTGFLHHAYLVEGERAVVREKILAFIGEDLNVPLHGNPDLWDGEFDTFGIDEGRMLRDLQTKRPVAGERRFFLVSANFFTREAQNALLKVFEEPSVGSHFFIITPKAGMLLPTLRSRLSIVSLKGEDDGVEKIARDFLAGDIVTRMKLIAPLIEDKDKAGTLRFLNGLEVHIDRVCDNTSKRSPVDDIIRFRGYMYGNAPSIKMILEHLAASLPRA